LCTYGTRLIAHSNADARDLIQFIPRALVFTIIIALYCTLYKFLRRPDTIQLSTQFMSGSGSQTQATEKPKVVMSISRFIKSPHRQQSNPVNPDAPWEAMEFVQLGRFKDETYLSESSSPQSFNPPGKILLNSAQSNGSPNTNSINGYGAAAESGRLASPPAPPTISRQASDQSTAHIDAAAWHCASGSQRPSEADTLVNGAGVGIGAEPIPTKHLIASPEQMSPIPVFPSAAPLPGSSILSPVMSSNGRGDFDDDLRLEIESTSAVRSSVDVERKTSAEEFRDFFKDNAAAPLQTSSKASPNGKPQMSASAYFNRQASLLMLWFPIAVSWVVGEHRPAWRKRNADITVHGCVLDVASAADI
jgi:hypothetical protein